MSEHDENKIGRQGGEVAPALVGEGGATVQAAEPAVVPLYVAPSLEEILASLRGEVCAACEGRKIWMQPFCNTCFVALTIWMRKSVTAVKPTYQESEYAGIRVHGTGSEQIKSVGGAAMVEKVALGFAEAYRAALRHLQLNPSRVKKLPVRATEWRFQSDEDLERAGFRMQRHDFCEVPGCGQRVVWYRTPKGARMPVNLENYQPHGTSCKDPEYFTRLKEQRKERQKQKRAQTFARRAAHRKGREGRKGGTR